MRISHLLFFSFSLMSSCSAIVTERGLRGDDEKTVALKEAIKDGEAAKKLRAEIKKKQEKEKRERSDVGKIALPGMKQKLSKKDIDSDENIEEVGLSSMLKDIVKEGTVAKVSLAKVKKEQAKEKADHKANKIFLPGVKTKKTKAESNADEKVKEDGPFLYPAPLIGTMVQLQGDVIKKDFVGFNGTVTAADTKTFVFAVKLTDGRELRKLPLSSLRFIPQ